MCLVMTNRETWIEAKVVNGHTLPPPAQSDSKEDSNLKKGKGNAFVS